MGYKALSAISWAAKWKQIIQKTSKKNSKNASRRTSYAIKSRDKASEYMDKALQAEEQGNKKKEKFLKKATNQTADLITHNKAIEEYKKHAKEAIAKIEASGDYKVYAIKGQTYLSGSLRPGFMGGPLGILTGADYSFKTVSYDKPYVKKVEKPKLSKVAKGVNEYIDSRKIPDHAKDEIRRAGVRYLDAYNKAQDHATKADFAPANQVKQHYVNYNAAMKKADNYYRDYKKVQDKWDFDVDNDDDLDVLESFRDRIKKK